MKLYLLIVATLVASAVHAQQPKATPSDDLPQDFLGLADLRASLQAQIAKLEAEVATLQEQKPETAGNANRIQTLQSSLDEEQKKPSPDQNIVQTLRKEIDEAKRNAPEIIEGQITAKQNELTKLRNKSGDVQKKISVMLSPEQSFKRWMSMTFAILIAFVIIGFFWVAGRDEKIRQAIFGGQAGIQFLTLFSLVIAIILFGITNILEGKELSALLGGLSGYILGRVTTEK